MTGHHHTSDVEFEKGYGEKTVGHDGQVSDEYDVQAEEPRELKRHLQGRHMQMIAIGGAIGAGFFVGSGSALSSGGPASLVICFSIIGVMLLVTMQALAELAVLFPVNGAFYSYAVRFVDPSWGFAIGWDYAIQWLTILPFEITAATITIGYWPGGAAINNGVWVAVFLTALIIIQFFGVRGFGEVEFVLSVIKVTAVVGFIILAIIIDCGGPSTSKLGYIGARYWYSPGAFANGFQGFCSVFVTASFAFGGTELTGLAAAEAANPLRAIPLATRQVFWRISIFYVLGLFMIGLVVNADNTLLLSASSYSGTSPFVIAIESAGIQVLPSIFNAVIVISVLSVANSSAYASTRTMQALGKTGMGPKWLAYVDKAGRPLVCILIQIAFGFLAFIIELNYTNGKAEKAFFNWLLALSGLANFFVWGTICWSHIRFRAGWFAQGRTLDEIPYKATFGVWGSVVGLALNIICLIASFYVALFPIGADPDAGAFFQQYLALPLILALYLFWKVWTWDTKLFIRAHEMDVTTGLRGDLDELRQEAAVAGVENTWSTLPYRAFRSLF